MIYNGTEYEVISQNSEYAVLRSGKTVITVSASDLKVEKQEEKPVKRKRSAKG